MAKYYVSPDGNDAWSGLTDQDPFATLEHAHSRVNVTEISAREDFVQFGFTPQKAGTEATPIIFSSYGLGVFKPTITGRKLLAGWTSLGNGLYKITDTGFMDRVKFLLVDGIQSTVATWPRNQVPYQITAGSGNGSGTISDSVNLAGKDFTGGEVVAKKLQWCTDTMQITNHSGSTLTFDGGSTTYNISVGWGYFVQNHRACCTQLGDWCQEGKDIVMHFGASNPSDFDIYAPYLERIHFNSRGHNQFHGWRFEMFNGGSDNTSSNPGILRHNSPNVKFFNCDFEFFGNTVHHETASNNTGFEIKGGSAKNCLNIFYWNRYSDTTPSFNIEDVSLLNIGHIPGAGGNGSISYTGIAFAGSTNGVNVKRNTLVNVGYNGISYGGYAYTVEGNIVINGCCVKDDGGCFYTYGKGDISKTYDKTKRIVRNNFGMDSVGTSMGKPSWFAGTSTPYASVEAFYFDDDSNEITFENNSGVNCRYGAKFHNNQQIISTGNLFVGNKRAQVIFANSNLGTYKNRDFVFTDNVLYSESDQIVMEISTQDSAGGNPTDAGLIGMLNNNYYMRPSNEDDIILLEKSGTGSGSWQYSIDQWKASAYGHDLNSKGTPTTSTVYEIALNDTLGHIVYPLERIRMDIDGLHISEPFGLGAFTAKLLLDDLGPIVPVPVDEYTVTLIQSDGGIAIGGGAYDEGDTATLVAMQNMDYQFDGWSEEGSIVSTENPWAFVVTGDRIITPVFTEVITPPLPGVIIVKGKFRIV